ncbi:MAG: hypothetical protein WC481_05435 [Candidatus Omnitrophota bacterium]
MRRPFFFAVLALILVSISHTANPEETTVAVEPVEPVETAEPAGPSAIVLLDDALPENAITQGKWDWDDSLKYSGSKSHTEPAAEGMAEHSFRMAPVDVPENHNIELYVYPDTAEPPEGIQLKISFESEGREGDIGVYREGEEEVFVFNDDEAVIYDGTLPEQGKWSKWDIDPDDLGLSGARITGISFVAYGGKVNWDLLQFVPSKK